MNVGDTFIWFLAGKREHLYIVLTDPVPDSGNFVAVNITKSVHGQKSFTLHAGDHPNIITDSDVNFGDAIIISLKKYERAVHWQQAIPCEPMRMDIVERIADALISHPAPSGDVIQAVRSHWEK